MRCQKLRSLCQLSLNEYDDDDDAMQMLSKPTALDRSGLKTAWEGPKIESDGTNHELLSTSSYRGPRDSRKSDCVWSPNDHQGFQSTHYHSV